MELRHLRYFAAVAEELNVRQAGRRLHVSQPPLSRQIRDLEEELGTKLFDRRKKKMTLTPAGESFLREARQILAHVERAGQLALAASRGETGQLTVGFLSALGGLLLPPAIRSFRRRFPAVDVTVQEMSPRGCAPSRIIPAISLGCCIPSTPGDHAEASVVASVASGQRLTIAQGISGNLALTVQRTEHLNGRQRFS